MLGSQCAKCFFPENYHFLVSHFNLVKTQWYYLRRQLKSNQEQANAHPDGEKAREFTDADIEELAEKINYNKIFRYLPEYFIIYTYNIYLLFKLDFLQS